MHLTSTIFKEKFNMNTNKYYNPKSLGSLLLGLLMVVAVSCDDHFDEVNSPSDRLTSDALDAASIGQAFAQAQYRGMWGSPGPFQLGHSLFSDIYAQYFQTTHESFDSDMYVEVGRWINGAYSDLYANSLPQLKFVEDFTQENGHEIENAMAKVWKVQMYHRITDYWGPIIYSEFGNGETSVNYDSQEDVYNNFFQILDEAIAVFEANPGVSEGLFNNHDLLFNGNVDQWLRYANSLKLRLAMRISYVDPTKAQAEAEEAVSSGVITDNADNAMIQTTGNNLNPYTIITQWGEFRMSATMESVLQGYDDPRAEEYFTPAEETGEVHGMRNGVPVTQKTRSGNNPKGSDVGQRWLPLSKGGDNYDMVVLRAPEVYFLRAEGAIRGWNMGGTALTLYNEGIRKSMQEYTDAADADINAYIASTNTPAAVTSKINPGDPMWDRGPMSDIPIAFDVAGGFERQLEQIITQKWLALYPDSPEAWAERRRTGYPVGYALITSQNDDLERTELFRRMTFVDTERSDNQAATTAAEDLLNGEDSNATRVWWDAKPIGDFPTIAP